MWCRRRLAATVLSVAIASPCCVASASANASTSTSACSLGIRMGYCVGPEYVAPKITLIALTTRMPTIHDE